MGRLTPNQIAFCIADVNWGPGGSRDAVIDFLDTAIAVCLAESGGDPNAVSSTNDHGLWQINKDAHPHYWKDVGDDTHTIPRPNIYNPFINTGAAKVIYGDAGGWSPWSAYKSGAYRKHLGHGEKAYNFLARVADKKATIDAINKKTTREFESEKAGVLKNIDVPDFGLGDLANTLVKSAKVAGFLFVALVIAILGVVFLLKDTAVGKIVNPVNKVKAAAKVVS